MADAGCVGILTTNGSPAMAPWGGREKTVGANPWSIATPGGSHGPVVLDIANTGVARGKIYAALQRGEAIPDSWALDADGRRDDRPPRRDRRDPPADGRPQGLRHLVHDGRALRRPHRQLLRHRRRRAVRARPAQRLRPPGARARASTPSRCPRRVRPADRRPHRDHQGRASGRRGSTEIFYPGEIENRAEARAERGVSCRTRRSTTSGPWGELRRRRRSCGRRPDVHGHGGPRGAARASGRVLAGIRTNAQASVGTSPAVCASTSIRQADDRPLRPVRDLHRRGCVLRGAPVRAHYAAWQEVGRGA